MSGDSPSSVPRLLPVVVTVLALLHAVLGIAPALFRIRNDFANYYVPARAVLQGDRLDRAYERSWFPREAARTSLPRLGSFVPHPPANGLLLLPVAFLPPPAAKAAWVALLALAGALAFLTLRGRLGLSPWMLALVFLLPTSSWANAFLYGQPYPLLLLLVCLSLARAMDGRDFAAGALLAPVAVLKLYGLPFLAWFLWVRRFRAAAGMVAGASALGLLSVAVLGWPVHEAWLREVLPASLAGEVQDPYSTIWGSFTSLFHRLFQRELDLNPAPWIDVPVLARALSRAVPVAVVALSVWAAGRAGVAAQAYAILTLASLAASPLTGSYHFVLLALPVAVLVSRADRGSWRIGLALALMAFATSPLPHYFAGFAHGAANVLAYPRLLAVLVLLGMAFPAGLGLVEGLAAAGLGVLAALIGGIPQRSEAAWHRLDEARGYLAAEPVACERLTWVTIAGEAIVRRDSAGLIAPEPLTGLRCRDGRLVEATEAASVVEASDADEAVAAEGRVRVFIEALSGELRESAAGGATRTLDRGRLRHPRLSPDASWVVYQAWEGSWNLRAVERKSGRVVRLTDDPGNELDPAWSASGDAVLFASDRRRGLASTALYSLPFRR